MSEGSISEYAKPGMSLGHIRRKTMRLAIIAAIAALINLSALGASFAQDAYGGTGGDAAALRNYQRAQ
jgi:hypothetical protein